MKKLLNFCLISSIIAFSPVLHAQDQMLTNPQRAPLEGEVQEGSPFQETQGPGKDGNEPWREAQGDGTMQTPIDGPHPDEDDSTQDSTTPPTSSDESATPESVPSDNEDEGTPVGQAASEGSKAAKRKQWQNIALASAAVVVAVTALILIANNDGHRKDD